MLKGIYLFFKRIRNDFSSKKWVSQNTMILRLNFFQVLLYFIWSLVMLYYNFTNISKFLLFNGIASLFAQYLSYVKNNILYSKYSIGVCLFIVISYIYIFYSVEYSIFLYVLILPLVFIFSFFNSRVSLLFALLTVWIIYNRNDIYIYLVKHNLALFSQAEYFEFINIGLVIFFIIFFYTFSYILIRFMESRRDSLLQTNLDIEKAKIELEYNEKFKDTFYSRLGHEIRNPMNAIIGIVDIIKNDKSYNLLQIKTLEIISNAALNLNYLLSNLLEMNRFETGVTKKINVKFNLVYEIKLMFEMLSALAKDKELDVQLDIHNLLDKTYYGDLGKIKSIILNIVHNSIKYTNSGFVKLNLYLEDIKPNGNYLVKFEIIDTGKGMSKEFLKVVFEEFSQEVRSNKSINTIGAGLGLNISKKYIDILEGTIHINSQINKGTIVSVVLELPVVLETQKLKNTNDIPLIKSRKVLLVDDSSINRILMMNVLIEIGANCIQAENGKEALEILEKNKDIELVITDLNMPIINGLELGKIVKSTYVDINLWLISGSEEILSDLDINHVFNNVLLKPINMNTLKNNVLSFFQE